MCETVDQGVRLVRQAVSQDSRRNYKEAARCYREAISIFHQVAKERNSSRRVQDFVRNNVGQYEERLKTLERYLLYTADITKLVSQLSDQRLEGLCGRRHSSASSLSNSNPNLSTPLQLLKKGRKEDVKKNYKAALTLYEGGLKTLQEVLQSEDLSEEEDDFYKTKYLLYQDRADAIRAYLKDSGRKISVMATKHTCTGRGHENSLLFANDPFNMKGFRDVESQYGSRESIQSIFLDNGCYQTELEEKQTLVTPMNDGQENIINFQDDNLSLASSSEYMKSSDSSQFETDSFEGKRAVPLASLDKELSLSMHSLQSISFMENIKDISLEGKTDVSYEILMNHSFDPEYATFQNFKKSFKDETSSQSSDSGYSDPSQDESFSRDAKSPESMSDWKQDPLSNNTSEEEETEDHVATIDEVVPNIVIVNESKQQNQEIGAMCKLRKPRFESPHEDLLTSHESWDNLAVLSQDEVDASPEVLASVKAACAALKSEDYAYVKTLARPREIIPPRAAAKPKGEHEDMNKGCYYLMTALDFCWCL